MTTVELRRIERALTNAVRGWTGAPLDPVIVEARMRLAVARARILMMELNEAAMEKKNGR